MQCNDCAVINPHMHVYTHTRIRAHIADRQSPDEFYEQQHPRLMSEARGAVEALVGATPGSVAMVENATTAGSAVAHALASRWHSGEWPKHDTLLLCSLTYDSVENAIVHYCGAAGATIDRVSLPLPATSKDEVVAAYAAYFVAADAAADAAAAAAAAGSTAPPPRPRVRAAMLDHIHSKSSYVMPIVEIIGLLRSHGVDFIYVDGAHAPGQLPLELPSFGCDAYAGNLHKWCFSGAGSAFVWCNPEGTSGGGGGDGAAAGSGGGGGGGGGAGAGAIQLHHPVVSHDLGKGFVAEADFTGTKDYSAFWTVPAAMQFAADMGGWGAIRRYCHTLVMAAGKMLAAAWGTELGQPEDMAGSMVLVGLPAVLGTSEADGAALRGRLLARDRIQVQYPVASTHSPACLYLRISAIIYNCEEDYVKLRDVVLAEVQAAQAATTSSAGAM